MVAVYFLRKNDGTVTLLQFSGFSHYVYPDTPLADKKDFRVAVQMFGKFHIQRRGNLQGGVLVFIERIHMGIPP